MPLHPFDPPRGRTETIFVDGEALRDNLVGDPTRRAVAVYLPEGYDSTDADYPLFVGLAGYTGSGLKQLAWRSFAESLPQRVDRLVAEGRMGPVVLALPDAFTSLGGNQYVDTPALGRWEAFLVDEMLPRIESTFRVRRDPRRRAVFGKSSGGYGALIQGMRHADRWGALACHSGDMMFDVVYRRDLHAALTALAPHDGRPDRFVDHLKAADRVTGGEFHVLMTLAMAASYDPEPSAPYGIRLPLDPHTGVLDEEAWSRWLRHDPLTLVERAEVQAALASLGGLYLDCGGRDEYHLHYGARALSKRLTELGIAHRYDEFDGAHGGTDPRMDVSLPFLYGAVTR